VCVRALIDDAPLPRCALTGVSIFFQSHEVWDILRDWELSLLETIHVCLVPLPRPLVHRYAQSTDPLPMLLIVL
jgi:hypothetical protein